MALFAYELGRFGKGQNGIEYSTAVFNRVVGAICE